MHYEILDDDRKKILPKLEKWKSDYVLAGGTALALRIDHRDSADFDFFTERNINTTVLYQEIEQVFSGQRVEKIQEENNTLSVLIDNEIRLSFMTYPYRSVSIPTDEPFLRIASIEDIACMKLSAITGRASNKDYIDLYYILHQIPLHRLLEFAQQKFPNFNANLALKSLVYFEDISEEPIRFRKGKRVTHKEWQSFLEKIVRELHG